MENVDLFLIFGTPIRRPLRFLNVSRKNAGISQLTNAERDR